MFVSVAVFDAATFYQGRSYCTGMPADLAAEAGAELLVFLLIATEQLRYFHHHRLKAQIVKG